MTNTSGRSERSLRARVASWLPGAARRAALARYEAALAELTGVCEAAGRGDLEPRAQQLYALAAGPQDPLWRVADGLNRTLDLTDTYIRASGAALKAASERKFYRRTIEGGMLGFFGSGARVITQASREIADQTRALVAAREARLALADDFERTVGALVETVAAAASQATASATSLADTARSAADQVAATAGAAQHIAHDVARAADQGTATAAAVAQIAVHADQTADATRQAVGTMQRAGETAASLVAATHEIASVVQIIQSVAVQTNLLALNAAVEAARAGDAGRGFAVVAGEVRTLAVKTADATRAVEDKVAAVRASVGSMVQLTESVSADVTRCRDAAHAIQTFAADGRAASEALDAGLRQAATHTATASAGAEATRQVVDSTTAASREVLAAAQELARTAQALDLAVGSFVTQVRRDD